MQTVGNHFAALSELASFVETGEHVQQYAALCHRRREDGHVEVLLLTTRETRRWSIPKGWTIKGLKPHQVAAREAWEEAGVVGKAKKKPFGTFTNVKTLKSGKKVAAFIDVHAVAFERGDPDFPEAGQREVVWVTPFEAANMVLEPGLKSILNNFGIAVRATNGCP